uniref:Palmitoyltransferase n=1 Tax=Glossina austeni TaxID=7395 RepID=A0A1A9VAV3_GLOAU
MGRINWTLKKRVNEFSNLWLIKWSYIKLCVRSLTYNEHLDASYASDVLMEPIYWFVDNYAHLLGPFFVVGVVLLTTAVVSIAYWIGLPFWWQKNQAMTVCLLVVGNWLLINVIFHYVMGVITPAGVPPEGISLTNAASICKKCIKPKPPRTHHCSANKCICIFALLFVLCLDAAAWLNNCVGYGNHRYFFLYMLYTTIGSLFLVVFGFEIGYRYLWLEHTDNWTELEPLEGHPVKINLSGHIIPVTHLNEYDEDILLPAQHDLPTPAYAVDANSPYVLARRRALWFMAFINLGVIMALGTLCCWHAKLISRGETSIEAHINQAQRKVMLLQNKIYINPYNFGLKMNWRLFLGVVRGRSFWRTVLLPSWHKPDGNGLSFHTVDNYIVAANDEWP